MYELPGISGHTTNPSFLPLSLLPSNTFIVTEGSGQWFSIFKTLSQLPRILLLNIPIYKTCLRPIAL